MHWEQTWKYTENKLYANLLMEWDKLKTGKKKKTTYVIPQNRKKTKSHRY